MGYLFLITGTNDKLGLKDSKLKLNLATCRRIYASSITLITGSETSPKTMENIERIQRRRVLSCVGCVHCVHFYRQTRDEYLL